MIWITYRLSWVVFVTGLVMSSGCQHAGEKGSDNTQTNYRPDEPVGAIVAAVMKANGGQDAWSNTRLLQWDFFGRRMWWWDKQTGAVRCEVPDLGLRAARQLDSDAGLLWKDGQYITQADSLSKYMDRIYQWWVNDSYWLVMPFKLEDPGVTLQYLGKRKTEAGSVADVLEMTFESVGITPENKYHLYVDSLSHHIMQWDFYRQFTDEEPLLRGPWTNYQKYGEIYLSDGRGSRKLNDLAVYKTVPASLFTDLTKPGKTFHFTE